MDWLETLLIAALAGPIIVAVWFGTTPAVRRARRASGGRPNMTWWVSFGFAVVVTAYVANQLPDHL